MRAYSIRVVPESWTEFMRSIRRSEDETQQEIAARAGGTVDQTTVSRWLKGTGGQPSVEKAVAFARAIGESPIRALLALRYLEPDDVTGEVRLVISPTELTDDALLQELASRLHTLRGQPGGQPSAGPEGEEPTGTDTEAGEDSAGEGDVWTSREP